MTVQEFDLGNTHIIIKDDCVCMDVEQAQKRINEWAASIRQKLAEIQQAKEQEPAQNANR